LKLICLENTKSKDPKSRLFGLDGRPVLDRVPLDPSSRKLTDAQRSDLLGEFYDNMKSISR
jgi:hypothetical protein